MVEQVDLLPSLGQLVEGRRVCNKSVRPPFEGYVALVNSCAYESFDWFAGDQGVCMGGPLCLWTFANVWHAVGWDVRLE